MHVQRHRVTVTTAAGGTAEAFTGVVNGRLLAVIYTKGDFATGVDFTITTETTSQNLWVQENVDASAVVAPRQPTHDYAGNASLFAAAGEPVEDYIFIGEERIKIAIAAGGAVKSGTFDFLVG